MEKGFGTQARRVLLGQVAPVYHRASGVQKQQVLEEFVSATGYARKYALWLLILPHQRKVIASRLIKRSRSISKPFEQSSIDRKPSNGITWHSVICNSIC